MPELGEWAVALAGSPWMFLVLYAFATIDGFFPPIPSESVVIALAALSVSGGGPDVLLLAVVAAAGAFSGDQIAYSLGRRVPVRRLRLMRSHRAQAALASAEAALAHRGAAFIIAARFVPVGRVAVNMTAGTVRFSQRRFSVLAAFAAVLWSAYTVVLGVGAAEVLEGHHPLVGVAVGVAGGLLLGAVVDSALQRVLVVVRGRRAPAPRPRRRRRGSRPVASRPDGDARCHIPTRGGAVETWT